MVDKKLAKKHWCKALDYYFECSPKVFKEARKAVELHPKWSRPHWLLGTAYLYVPPIDVESAIREFRKVVRKEPQWSTGHHNLGRCLAMQGQIVEALVPLRQVFRMEPEKLWARTDLAQCLLKRGEFREAITVLRGKPSLSPFYTVVDAHLLLAETFVKMDSQVEEARAEWEFILTLDESIPVNRLARAEARKRLQETEKR
jgi:tetratricopeptide (TPR) repeat protein